MAVDKHVVVIGGGPAGLMAAEVIALAGFKVDLYDAMPSVGRKFLLAGVGGMNITHAEDFSLFVARYAEATPWLLPYLHHFNAAALCDWVHGLGVQTFVGSSGRVFPLDMKAAPLLRAWLHRLRELGVVIHPRHRWQGWMATGELMMTNGNVKPAEQLTLKPSACVLALGGASWARLGSDGTWVSILRERAINVRNLVPSNCGFEVNWSRIMREQFAGAPLHTVDFEVQLAEGGYRRIRGEAVISEYGIEGSAIYALSAILRTQLEKTGSALLKIDLLPDLTIERILTQLQKPRGKNSSSNFMRKQLGLSPVKLALLREFTEKSIFDDVKTLAQALKNLCIPLQSLRPIDEAISSAGGVQQQAVNSQLMLQAMPGVFCAGEMLDWEAPTGGYLLTACFATGYAAGLGVVNFLVG